MVKKNEHNLKVVNFCGFLDYLALDLNYTNNYNFSSYYKILASLKNDEIMQIYNNFSDDYNLLDLVNYYYNNDANVKLLYNDEGLVVYFNDGKYFYHILVTIKHKIFKNYKNMPHFISELEEYLEFTFNS